MISLRKPVFRLLIWILIAVLPVNWLVPPVVLAQSATVQEYDANGNLTKDYQGRCYEYNDANQLKKITDCGTIPNTLSEYVYDYQGKRIRTIDHTGSGSTQEYTYTPTKEYQYYRNVQGLITWSGETSYFYANGEVVARKNNDDSYTYYHNDHLGSPNLETNATGQLVSRNEYTPYGKPTPTRNVGYNDRVQYTGQREDILGLNYYGARYYNSAVAHFTQPDPVLPNPYDPQALNRYAYVRNNPLKYTDPTGHIFWVPAQLYAISVLTSPDFNTDMAQLQMSGSDFAANPNAFTALGLAVDTVDTLALGVSLPGSAVGKGAKAGVEKGGELLGETIESTAKSVKSFKQFTKGNFRDNLSRLTGIKPKGLDAHHSFPKKFAEQFSKIGIDVNNPEFGTWWQQSAHRKNSYSINDEWQEAFEGGKITSSEDAVNFMSEQSIKYGFDNPFRR